ncbi:hypothetical protein [Mycobacterium shottsii]|uniref:hypothetical protein n=1 Tax=Mycobacterium shottsii TaxID=133549 RepID=UPI0018E916A6|nr:hypothetical protein [Mycobacterium shottsii]
MRMPHRRLPQPAIVHRLSPRLLVFNLPNQLVLCFAKGVGYVRAISNRHQRRKAGQTRAQCDALLLAAAVLQGDIHDNLMGIPPSQVGPERRQFLHHVAALLLFETRTQTKHISPDMPSLALRIAHCGLISGVPVADGRIGGDIAVALIAPDRHPSAVVLVSRGGSALAARRGHTVRNCRDESASWNDRTRFTGLTQNIDNDSKPA